MLKRLLAKNGASNPYGKKNISTLIKNVRPVLQLKGHQNTAVVRSLKIILFLFREATWLASYRVKFVRNHISES